MNERTRRAVALPYCPVPGAQAYRFGECLVIVSRDGGYWHMSISHPSRDPTWDEIRDARYELLPNHVTMAMLLPPREEYVNIHLHCFHLWEVTPDGKVLA